MTTTVDLGAPLERFVEEAVGSGRYGSRSEVLREGVRLVQEREQRLQHLHRLVDEGLADVDAGRTVPLDEAVAHAMTVISERAKRRA